LAKDNLLNEDQIQFGNGASSSSRLTASTHRDEVSAAQGGGLPLGVPVDAAGLESA